MHWPHFSWRTAVWAWERRSLALQEQKWKLGEWWCWQPRRPEMMRLQRRNRTAIRWKDLQRAQPKYWGFSASLGGQVVQNSRKRLLWAWLQVSPATNGWNSSERPTRRPCVAPRPGWWQGESTIPSSLRLQPTRPSRLWAREIERKVRPVHQPVGPWHSW